VGGYPERARVEELTVKAVVVRHGIGLFVVHAGGDDVSAVALTIGGDVGA
jgi:hypothetical protein